MTNIRRPVTLNSIAGKYRGIVSTSTVLTITANVDVNTMRRVYKGERQAGHSVRHARSTVVSIFFAQWNVSLR